MALLLGPPSLRQSPTPAAQQPQAQAPSGDPFIDLMVADYNNLAQPPITRPQMGFTENGSATFVTTGDPCLDLFFHVVPNTPASYLNQQLPLAWAHNALTTLKLICNLRGVRGTGKSDKEGFYTAAFWLHKNHPKTLACNVASLAEFGYFKDLPEILYRLLEGEDVRKKLKSEWLQRKSGRGRVLTAAVPFSRGGRGGGGAKKRTKSGGRRGNNSRVAREVRVLNSMERAKSEKEKASALRKEKFAAMAKKAVERYQRDPDYRFLHERVSDLFAECLKSDMENLKSNQYKKISLAAKWCPSLDSSFDRATLLCESIARKVFARESHPEYEGIEDAHYAYRVRDRLRKDVLVPLRIVLELPEVYMGANLWGAIPYNRVASVAMKLYKEKFLKHDEERFKKYLEDVKAGKSTIAAGALLPHEIIASLNDGDGGQVAELQWKRVVDDLLKEGTMKNCLAVCDVSGSMDGTPMDVCVALGMLVAELNEEPWKGKVITFSANPQLHLIQGNDLRSKSEFVKRMDWGGNTDFQKVFDLILQVAVKGNLKPEQMIKRVFVFSDMEFDQASGYGYGYGGYGYGRFGSNDVPRGWETDYEVIQRKYREKGYGDAVPQIVFWNLRDSKATPVPGTQPGVALLSGFSKNLLKLFLDNDGEIRPDTTMEAAISGPEYQKLVVLD
ncbi:hypothetical protein RchiOBHm_Chr7g0184991 [Rosa chinensis]|uniref:von Willebrand factor, type A n=1 Tax=Rosa chinensis TaxID=74649 RepID=A0A2P6P3J7_ROSCH|nr:uncharacterized protein LOC112179557 [Rosa chinensis]PRQ16506.1 hypothetical protein RchiOBHm_Chr7g0184991 [Rosa chinensis]